QRRPNMFTTAVANIAPGQEIEVRLTYVEKVTYDGGRFRLRFPMTITPRYIPGAPRPATETSISAAPGSGWATSTDQVPDAVEITPYLDPRRPTGADPINPIELAVALDSGLPLADISSAYHDIHVARQGGQYEISLTAGRVPMDRDFELTWQPAVGSEPAAALFTQTLGDKVYALAMILPPVQPTGSARLPRETVFIIDKSGSMGGDPIRQARAALELGLSRLAPGDHFNIIAFNDTPTALFRDSRPADSHTLGEARRFVQRLSAGGGTEMMSALNLTFAGDPENASGLLRQVVFITDGAVGNEDALFKAISDGLSDRRLFTVGIGSAPNSHFMRKAAQFGRGTFTYIGKPTEVEQKMDELFARLEKPMLRNVVLEWPDAAAVVEPDPIPDLYDGQPIVVTARLDRLEGELRASGETTDGQWQQTLMLNTAAGHSGIATVWARDRIARIEDRIALEGESANLRKRMLDLALNHKLVSRFTSFVAIEKKITRPKSLSSKSHDVPNLRPAGQSPQPFAYPQTATSATEAFWLGLLGMIAALLLWLRVYTLPGAAEPGRE
ncbi:MAG: marine proteobacterial sortase target protein, partial [Gammaproteobacteria bacterium]